MADWLLHAFGNRAFAALTGLVLFTLAVAVVVTGERSPQEKITAPLTLPEPVALQLNRLRVPEKTVLEHIKETGRLVVLTRNAPTAYYIERDVPAGFEYDLAQAFAEALGVKAEMKVLPSEQAIRTALALGEGHIAAADLSHHRAQEERVVRGPAYRTVSQQLVCHKDSARPSHAKRTGGAGGLAIAYHGYDERLADLEAQAPALNWSAIRNLDTEDLLDSVAEGMIDCTVGNSTLVSMHRRYHPELVVPFDLTEAEPVAWLLMEDAPDLTAAVEAWFAQLGTKRLLARLEERYFGHVPDYDYLDIATFRRRMTARLPRYRPLFETAAAETGLPWTLLAAVAYQESHWAPDARSPTGVRGMMMLTNAAASEVGVSNRLDPDQSIAGGARYLATVKDRLPESVEGEDRLWLALAAYNVGLGHLYDARTLARRADLDPDRWVNLKAVLPKLAQPATYKTLKYGYARGAEPVHYVRRVRHYQDILERALSPDV